MDWELFAWLKRGKRRRAVLQLFVDTSHPLSIKDVKELSKIAISQSSVIVKELHKKGFLECLNPNDNIGKLFVLSEIGKEYKKYFERDKKR